MHVWTQPLWRSLVTRTELPAQPLLLTGPKGIGKSAFAQAVAQWLLCQARSPAGGCNECLACRLIESGNHPDFRMLQPGGQDEDQEASGNGDAIAAKRVASSRWIKVEQVRELAGHYWIRRIELLPAS